MSRLVRWPLSIDTPLRTERSPVRHAYREGRRFLAAAARGDESRGRWSDLTAGQRVVQTRMAVAGGGRLRVSGCEDGRSTRPRPADPHRSAQAAAVANRGCARDGATGVGGESRARLLREGPCALPARGRRARDDRNWPVTGPERRRVHALPLLGRLPARRRRTDDRSDPAERRRLGGRVRGERPGARKRGGAGAWPRGARRDVAPGRLRIQRGQS